MLRIKLEEEKFRREVSELVQNRFLNPKLLVFKFTKSVLFLLL